MWFNAQRKPSYKAYGSKLIHWLYISSDIPSVREAKLTFPNFWFCFYKNFVGAGSSANFKPLETLPLLMNDSTLRTNNISWA